MFRVSRGVTSLEVTLHVEVTIPSSWRAGSAIRCTAGSADTPARLVGKFCINVPTLSKNKLPTVCKKFPLATREGQSRLDLSPGLVSANHRGMRYANSRRCALWVRPRVFVVAEELAHSIGLDVDTFIESTVLALHDQEAPEGRPGARDEVVEKGHVISIADRRGRLRRSG